MQCTEVVHIEDRVVELEKRTYEDNESRVSLGHSQRQD